MMNRNASDLIPGTIDDRGKAVIPPSIIKTLLGSKKQGQVVVTRFMITMQGYDCKVRCLRLFTPHRYKKFKHNIETSAIDMFTELQIVSIKRQIITPATRHFVKHNGEITIYEGLYKYANLSGDVWFVRDERGVYIVSRPTPSLVQYEANASDTVGYEKEAE